MQGLGVHAHAVEAETEAEDGNDVADVVVVQSRGPAFAVTSRQHTRVLRLVRSPEPF